MAFENGSISFRMVELPRPLPEDAVDRFARQKAGSLDAVAEGVSTGWVTSRHLLDSNITDETAKPAGWLRLDLRQAERKVPTALLKAECRMEELAVMAAENKPYLKAKARSEIRQMVLERLMPDMPPQLKAIPFVYRPGTTHLFVGALPTAQWDLFNTAWVSTLGMSGSPSTPETLGETLSRVDLRDLPGTSFSPEMEGVAMEVAPGREFLTWLWFKTEAQNGRMALADGRELGVLLEGPLTFVHEGDGAHAAVLKKGMPENSIEAKTCLLSGKKLKEARITFALDEETTWSFGFEADQFLIRSLKLPKGEMQLDSISRFQERMQFLDQWRDLFLDLFRAFLSVRSDSKKWSGTLTDIRQWISGRPSRR